MTRFLICTTVALVIVSAVLGWMMRTYTPGATVADVFFYMTWMLKFLGVWIVALTGVAIIGGFRRNVVRVRKAAVLMLTLGVWGAAYGELNVHFGTLIDNVKNFETLASWRIDSLAILALGLFGAVSGLGVLHLRGGVPRA